MFFQKLGGEVAKISLTTKLNIDSYEALKIHPNKYTKKSLFLLIDTYFALHFVLLQIILSEVLLKLRFFCFSLVSKLEVLK